MPRQGAKFLTAWANSLGHGANFLAWGAKVLALRAKQFETGANIYARLAVPEDFFIQSNWGDPQDPPGGTACGFSPVGRDRSIDSTWEALRY